MFVEIAPVCGLECQVEFHLVHRCDVRNFQEDRFAVVRELNGLNGHQFLSDLAGLGGVLFGAVTVGPLVIPLQQTVVGRVGCGGGVEFEVEFQLDTEIQHSGVEQKIGVLASVAEPVDVALRQASLPVSVPAV